MDVHGDLYGGGDCGGWAPAVLSSRAMGVSSYLFCQFFDHFRDGKFSAPIAVIFVDADDRKTIGGSISFRDESPVVLFGNVVQDSEHLNDDVFKRLALWFCRFGIIRFHFFLGWFEVRRLPLGLSLEWGRG